jgi:hypothetical protein
LPVRSLSAAIQDPQGGARSGGAGDVATVRGVTTTQGGTVFLPGVVIVLRDPSGARHAITNTSDDTGHFTFTNVPPGQYEIKASLAGFDDVTQKIRVEAGKPLDVALDLPVGKVSESVSVVDRAPNAVPAASGETVSGSTLTQAPLKGDDYQALLPLLPGVVRGSDGRMRMEGGEPTQSGLQVSSASVTDPSTGDFAFELPGDAVESVVVLQNPYSAEYGRFSSGVTEIRTRKGGDRWQIIPNSFVPRLQVDQGGLRGISAFTPRLSIGGPLVKDQVFLSENLQYRLVKSDVKSLPGDPSSEVRSFDSYTRLDANLGPRNALTAAFAIYPRTIEGINLNTFNPLPATPTFRQGGFNIGMTDKATLSSSSVLDTTVNVKQYDVHIFGQGARPEELTVQGIGGNYFNQQTRNTRTVQAVSVFTWSPKPAAARHLVKVGLDLMAASYDGTSTSHPVEIRRPDGTLSEVISFGGPTVQAVAGTDVSVFAQDEWRASDRLQVQFGGRMDRDGVLDRVNFSPRSGFTLALDRDSSAVLRGGFGLFYQRTPLTVGAFDSMETRSVTPFAADGVTPLGLPVIFTNLIGTLQTPYAVIGNLEYDQRLNERLLFKVNVLHRQAAHEFIVNPLAGPAPVLLLDSDGRSNHWEGELTMRYTPGGRTNLTVSYVRSRSEADLNSFDSYFGNFRDPVVVANQYSLTTTDVPHRLLLRGVIGLPNKWEVAPVVEVRSGFPYSLVDASRQIVGVRNQGGRFPALATVDLSLQRPFRIHGVKTRIGVRVFNALNRFNPRDVMNNVDSPLFGSFFNPIPRSFGLNFWIDR